MEEDNKPDLADLEWLLKTANKFSDTLVEQLQDHETRLIIQDREQTRLTHDLAEVTTRLIQMRHLLQSINERLTYLEAERLKDDSYQ